MSLNGPFVLLKASVCVCLSQRHLWAFVGVRVVSSVPAVSAPGSAANTLLQRVSLPRGQDHTEITGCLIISQEEG